MTTTEISPKDIKAFHYPKDQLRVTIGNSRSILTVTPAWVAPLSHPGEYLSLLNGKGEEFLLVEDLDQLNPESRPAIEEEIRRRYLTAVIHKVISAKTEWGATYFTVITDRGERDFVMQSLQENAQWLKENHLLLVDIDGNRFEAQDISKLDAESQAIIEKIV
jgi:hypothetical protein